MNGNPSYMNNHFTFPGVPLLTPIHLKRRSDSNSSPSDTLKSASTSPTSSLVPPSIHSGGRPSTAGSASPSTAAGATNVKHPYTVLKRGKKHHAYPVEIAPYPLDYEPRILDCEALDNSCTSSSNLGPISPSLQPHIQLSDPSTHPKRVLDIGCGVGHWVVNAASLWPNTTFVGLDLVAVQPDPFAMDRIRLTVTREKERRNRNKGPAKLVSPSSPSPIHGSEERDTVQDMLRSTTTTNNNPRRKSPPSVSSSDSGSSFGIPANSIYRRIKWVHHNFLTKQLPFKDGEFDFVHIRGIAQGVPEDQWDFLLSDVARVLCPKGSLEIIEEDILFPTVLAPTLSLDLSAGAKNGTRSRNRTEAARQAALTSVNAQLALDKQSLFYSEETRPSLFLASSNKYPPRVGMSDSPTSLSPASPRGYESSSSPLDMGAPSSRNTTIYGIPASYLQYAQTIPALAHSLPPLALVNPFLHQRQKSMQAGSRGGTTPFAQDHAILEQLFLAVFNKRWINVRPTSILGSVLAMQLDLGGVITSECLDIWRPGYVSPEEPRKARKHGGWWWSEQTLLDETAADANDTSNMIPESVNAIESSSEGEYETEEDEEETHEGVAPLSPPLTPKPSELALGEKPSLKKKKENRINFRWKSEEKTDAEETVDWRKYPSLTLTAGLRLLFPALDNEATKTWHLQRAWENVVACKEAMWEAFLEDSANRDREAMQAVHNSIAQQLGSSPPSSNIMGAMGLVGGMGGMGGLGPVPSGLPSMPYNMTSGVGIPMNRGVRQSPTLLDELEWVDSDMRRSERERFDILLDRYEMRIRRYCAKWYENTRMPCLVARDRKAWATAGAELYSSDEEFDYGEVLPDPIADPKSPNVHTSGLASSSAAVPPVPSPWDTSQTIQTVIDEHEGNHSSADEATLAELSPKALRASKFCPITVTEPPIRDFDSTSALPEALENSVSQTNLKVPVLTKLRTGAMLKIAQSTSASELKGLSNSASVASTLTNSSQGDKSTRRKRVTLPWDCRSKEELALPSRVFRAFIATKTQAA